MINVRLAFPPSVNNYTTVARGRKILSARGRRYKQDSIYFLMEQKAPKHMEGRLEVSVDVYPPDKRRRDLDNILKPCLDSLQDYGMFDDDEQIDILHVRRLKVSKPGYVRIHVSQIERF